MEPTLLEKAQATHSSRYKKVCIELRLGEKKMFRSPEGAEAAGGHSCDG